MSLQRGIPSQLIMICVMSVAVLSGMSACTSDEPQSNGESGKEVDEEQPEDPSENDEPVVDDDSRRTGLPKALPQQWVETYRKGLDFPVDLAWARGTDTLFFTEKATGKIRVLHGRELAGQPCADLDVDSEGSRGATGLVLDPFFEDNHYLYVYYTNASPLENRVTRFVVRGNKCIRPRHVVTGIYAGADGYTHQGGQLEFVGGKLFVSTGDGGRPHEAQSTESLLGKILRYNRDGSIPPGNPFSRPGAPNPVWTYGHRNPFGLATKPGTELLFETENGPECDDEVNLILKGRNYGWGQNYSCGSRGDGPRPVQPLWRWTQTIAPTDPWWYVGALYVGDFNLHDIHRFTLNPRGNRVLTHHKVIRWPYQISDISQGPGGYLYFATIPAIQRIVPQD